MTLWVLIILLGNGRYIQTPVESIEFCGLKSRQLHYELMIEDRFLKGNWYCENVMTGKKVSAYEWAKNPKYNDPFYKGE